MLTADDDVRTTYLAEEFLRGLVPLADVLVILDMDRSTYYRYVDEGILPRVKHRNRTYVPESAITEYKQRLLDEANQEQARNARNQKRRK